MGGRGGTSTWKEKERAVGSGVNWVILKDPREYVGVNSECYWRSFHLRGCLVFLGKNVPEIGSYPPDPQLKLGGSCAIHRIAFHARFTTPVLGKTIFRPGVV